MFMYIASFLLICMHLFLEVLMKKKGKRNLYLISCGLLLAMSVFRSADASPWPDTGRYLEYYRYMQHQWKWDIWDIHEWEPGFMLIMKLVGFLFKSDRAFMVIFGSLILIPIFKSIWMYSKCPQMSLLVFCAHSHFTQTSVYRQWCAVAILTFSYRYIKERRFLPFSAIVLTAAFFHRSALIFVIVYFFYNYKISSQNMVKAYIAAVFIGLSGRYILPVISRFARVEVDLGFHGGITNFVFLCVCLILIKYWNKSEQDDEDYRIFYTMLLIAVSMQPLSFIFSLWSRVVLLFSFSLVFLIPDTVYKIGRKNTADFRSKAAVYAAVCAVLFARFVLFQDGSFQFMWA